MRIKENQRRKAENFKNFKNIANKDILYLYSHKF